MIACSFPLATDGTQISQIARMAVCRMVLRDLMRFHHIKIRENPCVSQKDFKAIGGLDLKLDLEFLAMSSIQKDYELDLHFVLQGPIINIIQQF